MCLRKESVTNNMQRKEISDQWSVQTNKEIKKMCGYTSITITIDVNHKKWLGNVARITNENITMNYRFFISIRVHITHKLN